MMRERVRAMDLSSRDAFDAALVVVALVPSILVDRTVDRIRPRHVMAYGVLYLPTQADGR